MNAELTDHPVTNITKPIPLINLSALDSLRGLLAVYVLAGHTRWLLWAGHAEWTSSQHPAWQNIIALSSALLRYGHEAVMGFFVLSGFFIHLRAAQDFAKGGQPLLNLPHYARRRLHRLVPTYALAMVLTLAFDLVGRHNWPALYSATSGDDLLNSSFARMGYSATSVVPALCLLPSCLGQHFGSNAPLWSLGYEVVYYAVYPLWLGLRLQFGRFAYLLLPVSILAGSSLLTGWPALVLAHYSIWLTGAALAECLTAIRRVSTMVPIAMIITAATALGLHHLPVSRSLIPSLILAVVYGGALVGAFALLSERWSSSLALRALQYFGKRSYTLYIVHFPLLALLSAWVFHEDGSRPLSGWLALGGFGLVLGIGCLCFHFCERHFLHERIRVA